MYITVDTVLKILGMFTAACVAGGWLVKIVKALKKPSDDVNTKLDRDNKRLNKLEDEMDYLKNAMSMSLQCSLVMLGHMRTNNNTGEITRQESELQEFLTRR